MTSKRFATTGAGVVFPYQPFDPALGELHSVRVHGDMVMIATGTAYPMGSPPYVIQLFLSLDISPLAGHGFGFTPGWELGFDDTIGPSFSAGPIPFSYINLQQFSFTVDAGTDAIDIVPLEFSSPTVGYATLLPLLPLLADTTRAHFTGTSGDESSFGVFEMSVTDGVVLNPLRFGGGLTVEYRYVPHDLDVDADRVQDGEFDNGLDSWDTGGDGSADVVNQPPGGDNQVIRMTTSSPVTLEQVVDMPDEPFRILSVD